MQLKNSEFKTNEKKGYFSQSPIQLPLICVCFAQLKRVKASNILFILESISEYTPNIGISSKNVSDL